MFLSQCRPYNTDLQVEDLLCKWRPREEQFVQMIKINLRGEINGFGRITISGTRINTKHSPCGAQGHVN